MTSKDKPVNHFLAKRYAIMQKGKEKQTVPIETVNKWVKEGWWRVE
tara:strand:+ start:494 stop:631 length:138 start_codon:yes stop_codon:yes gene_type:complete